MGETKIIKLKLPFPPSQNALTRHGNGVSYSSKIYIDYKSKIYYIILDYANKEGIIFNSCRGRKYLYKGDFEVSIYLHPEDNRRRDIDNYSKALLDSLTFAGFWIDDKYISKLHIYRLDPNKEAYIDITILCKEK